MLVSYQHIKRIGAFLPNEGGSYKWCEAGLLVLEEVGSNLVQLWKNLVVL